MVRNRKRVRRGGKKQKSNVEAASGAPANQVKLRNFASKAVRKAEIKMNRGTVLDKVNKKIQDRKSVLNQVNKKIKSRKIQESRVQNQQEFSRVEQIRNPWQSEQMQSVPSQSQMLQDFARLQQEQIVGPISPVPSQFQAQPQPQFHRRSRGVDLQFAGSLPPLEMLRYVQKCCLDYAEELDARYPDVRKVMGRLVKTNQNLVPCDIYNQSGFCQQMTSDEEVIHLDENGSRRVHSCTVCYFTMGGMINLHRQNQCPLLDLV